MIFCEADKDDLREILSIYSYLEQDTLPADYEKAKEIWDKTFTGNMPKHYVAKENDKVIATCNISVISNLTNQGRPFAVIENVITHPDYRRKGIGKKVIQMAVEYAKSMKCYKVILLSNIKRKEAHEFYRAIGFDGDSKKGFHMKI